MKKQINPTIKAHFIRSKFYMLPRPILIAFVLCAAVCWIVIGIPTTSGLAFLRPETPSKACQRSLTFAERVAYQRAIEDVYWRHRIWPKENRGPKPSLDAVMSQTQLEKKVEDYLRNSQALEDHWQRPLTAQQLQAEMERMAQNTKQPEMLRDLFDALGNDPFVIAECLARPILAARLVSGLTSGAEHASFRAKSRLQASHSLRRSQAFNSAALPIGNSTGSFDIAQVDMARNLHTGTYRLPQIECTDDTWTATSTDNPPEGRFFHTAVWTGSEMIVWGGVNGNDWLNTGGKYDPSTDSWTATSTTNAPDGRQTHTAVWTGSEMIIWGGVGPFIYFNTGGRYNPSTDSWIATSTINAPTGRYQHTAIWTGSEMIVWGGEGPVDSNTGGRYNPSTDSWIATSTTNAPTARDSHSAVWTGSEMIVWGGTGTLGWVNTGGRYDPGTDSWAYTTATNAPTPRDVHTAVWTGSEMIVWGGYNNEHWLNTGGRYNPSTESWTPTSSTNAPVGRIFHTAVWTGNEMIIWGGEDSNYNHLHTGGRYNLSTDSWTATSVINAPSDRLAHAAVWTGSEMIVWGGGGVGTYLYTGGRYCAQFSPATPTPTPTASPTPTPTPTACDTGIIVNGGFETGTFPPWVIDGHNNDPVITHDLPHNGTLSALAGDISEPNEPEGDSSFYQQFVVPAGGGTLSFWHLDYTTDFIFDDWQDAYITNSSGTILQTIFHQCLNGQSWLNTQVSLAAYAGMTVRIKFLVHQNGFGSDTGMYVDDVQLLGPCGLLSPTPTPTATATPIVTATTTPALTPTPIVTPTMTPTATPTATPTTTPIATPTATTRPTPTPRPNVTPRIRPTPPPRPSAPALGCECDR
jgi:N-acetylneuraminic acid mutarotase